MRDQKQEPSRLIHCKIHFIIPFTNHIIQKLYQELRILQITVYYKELLTINCQGTNHPRSILSFMDITG